MSVSEILSEILPFAVDGVYLSPPVGNVINFNTEDEFVCSGGQDIEKIFPVLGFLNHLLFHRGFMCTHTAPWLFPTNETHG